MAVGATLPARAEAAAQAAGQNTAQQGAPNKPLALADYEPRSMLRVQQTQVEKSRFPAIDFHTHI